jgi:hypothetical protein
MKVYVLDTVIFPSMANLIFFFEAISTNKNLADAFEDELVELLGNQKIRASSHSRNEARSSSQQFMVNPLARLVLAILTIHNLPKQINRSKKIKTHEIPKPSSDFRVGLMYQLLCIIGDKLDALLSAEYHTNSQIWHSAIQDFNRVKGWLALLTRTVEENPQTYDRIIEPTKYTKNS